MDNDTVELMTPTGSGLLALRDEAKELVSAIDRIDDLGWVAGKPELEHIGVCLDGTESAMAAYRRSSAKPPVSDAGGKE
ncbi:MAG: hypothetical protein OXK17_10155 [Thaumarchaeota archaeon]|nr:hypothetical protein [Nitrososphaerota archaeon]